MKIKLLLAVAVFLSLNFGSNIPTQATAQPKPPKQTDLNKILFKHQQLARLPKVIAYLETRAHKTAYVFSGDKPTGWDCSGLVRYAYKQLGVTLPHSANAQGHIGHRVSKPIAGDIVVFAYKGRTDFYHSAIYLGNNLIINANRNYGTTVIEPLSNFSKAQIRFIRILSK
jgi:cell wall-associated NlpC family hydrolase